MNIMLTNDDGIRAPGIEALYHALVDTHDRFGGPIANVWTIAPLTVQSATSHGVTFNEPLMVSQERVFSGAAEGLAVDGRPADCVKLGISALWPERFGDGAKPDLLISGMNSGANCGINVIYSGTVAAALEASFLGVPSIAVSLHIGAGRPDYTRGAAHARRAIERIIDAGVGDAGLLKPHSCANVNIPVCDDKTVPPTTSNPPISVCPMNTHGLIDNYEKRASPSGDTYYWAAHGGLDFREADDGTDVARLFERHITITPLLYDLTRRTSVEEWANALDEPRRD